MIKCSDDEPRIRPIGKLVPKVSAKTNRLQNSFWT